MEGKSLAKTKNWIFLFLLLGLFILRFPFLILSCYKINLVSPELVSPIYYGGTYLLAAIMIFLMRDSLSSYNMGRGAIIIYIAAPFAIFLSQAAKSIDSVHSDLWFRMGVSLCLLIALIISRPKLRKRSAKQILLWILISIIVGICVGVIVGKILSIQTRDNNPMYPTILTCVTEFFIQLGNAAAIEEPLFRGFLWGFLKKLHWHDLWIWLFQAVLFWLGHIYYLGVVNYSFFIIVPACGLILGFIVWRSRSIGTSMIVHSLINSLGSILAYYPW
jgi:membrane protease YdiL (CAAX protease family)